MLKEKYKEISPSYYSRYGGRVWTIVKVYDRTCSATHRNDVLDVFLEDVELLGDRS